MRLVINVPDQYNNRVLAAFTAIAAEDETVNANYVEHWIAERLRDFVQNHEYKNAVRNINVDRIGG